MERPVFLIRAVNVGGTTLPMADLRAWAKELGATGVATHLASGNLLCTPPGDASDFAALLETLIGERLGVPREVMTRTAAELRAALDAHPFPVDDQSRSHIAFMPGEPAPSAIAAAREIPVGDDAWRVIGRDLHIRYAHGAGRPDMNVNRLARRLGLPVTARNMRTVRALADRAAEVS